MKYANGNTVTGTWKDDMLNGNVTYTWKNGDVYKGDYLRGQRSGQGVMTWANKNRYEGKFQYDFANGQGKFFKNDVLFFEGDFSGGTTSTYGKNWILDDGTLAKRTIYSDGSLFELYFPDGRIFYGAIKNIGNYMPTKEIEPQEGYMLYPDGKQIIGQWEKGELKKTSSVMNLKMNNAVYDYVKGKAFYGYKKYADAIKSFNTAESQNCKEDSLRLYRGLSYFSISKNDSAIIDIGAYLKKVPKSKEALEYRAKSFLPKKIQHPDWQIWIPT
jgi:tetratricopeptide (TPR) repeat protein